MINYQELEDMYVRATISEGKCTHIDGKLMVDPDSGIYTVHCECGLHIIMGETTARHLGWIE